MHSKIQYDRKSCKILKFCRQLNKILVNHSRFFSSFAQLPTSDCLECGRTKKPTRRNPIERANHTWSVVPRVYLFVFLPNPANCRKRNFANSERKENSNSKTIFRWIPTEISVISTEIRWFLTGKWCQLWFSYCSRGQMKNFWIPTLFSFSRLLFYELFYLSNGLKVI